MMIKRPYRNEKTRILYDTFKLRNSTHINTRQIDLLLGYKKYSYTEFKKIDKLSRTKLTADFGNKLN